MVGSGIKHPGPATLDEKTKTTFSPTTEVVVV
jgi:hypothetical protein